VHNFNTRYRSVLMFSSYLQIVIMSSMLCSRGEESLVGFLVEKIVNVSHHIMSSHFLCGVCFCRYIYVAIVNSCAYFIRVSYIFDYVDRKYCCNTECFLLILCSI